MMFSRFAIVSNYFNYSRLNCPIYLCQEMLKIPKAHFCVNTSTYDIKSSRLKEIAKSPSGWVPPSNPLPSLPFHIRRSKTNNLPVYIDKKGGGSLVLTIIRNITGDLDELVKLLKQHLGNNVHFQQNEITSQVKIKGYHKEHVVRLLKELGF